MNAEARHAEQWPEGNESPERLRGQVRQLVLQLAQVRGEAANSRSTVDSLSQRLAQKSAETEYALTILGQLAQASAEMLLFGEHEGACDNGPDYEKSCTLHLDSTEIRQCALRAALAEAADLLPGWEEPFSEERSNIAARGVKGPPKPHIPSKRRPRP